MCKRIKKTLASGCRAAVQMVPHNKAHFGKTTKFIVLKNVYKILLFNMPKPNLTSPISDTQMSISLQTTNAKLAGDGVEHLALIHSQQETVFNSFELLMELKYKIN